VDSVSIEIWLQTEWLGEVAPACVRAQEHPQDGIIIPSLSIIQATVLVVFVAGEAQAIGAVTSGDLVLAPGVILITSLEAAVRPAQSRHTAQGICQGILRAVCRLLDRQQALGTIV
jgi:hypothetical protein